MDSPLGRPLGADAPSPDGCCVGGVHLWYEDGVLLSKIAVDAGVTLDLAMHIADALDNLAKKLRTEVAERIGDES